MLKQQTATSGRPGVIDIAVTLDGIRDCRIEGFADIEGKRPMAMDTLLWMASTGKVVTSVAFMTLVDAGLAALDDPAWKYLPHFRHLYRALDPEHPNDGSSRLRPPSRSATCFRTRRACSGYPASSRTAS